MIPSTLTPCPKRGAQSQRSIYNNKRWSGDRACVTPQPQERYHGRGVKPRTKSKKLISLIFPSFSVVLFLENMILALYDLLVGAHKLLLIPDHLLLPWSWFLSTRFDLPCVHFPGTLYPVGLFSSFSLLSLFFSFPTFSVCSNTCFRFMMPLALDYNRCFNPSGVILAVSCIVFQLNPVATNPIAANLSSMA